MPIGPFRTHTQGVNVRDLERVFDAGAEVTPESLKAKRLIRTTRIDVKILGQGDLTKKLTVSAHGVSKSAREKIEGAGAHHAPARAEGAQAQAPQRLRRSRPRRGRKTPRSRRRPRSLPSPLPVSLGPRPSPKRSSPCFPG